MFKRIIHALLLAALFLSLASLTMGCRTRKRPSNLPDNRPPKMEPFSIGDADEGPSDQHL